MTRRDDKSPHAHGLTDGHELESGSQSQSCNDQSPSCNNEEKQDFADYVDSFFQVDNQLVGKTSVASTVQLTTDEDLINAMTSQTTLQANNSEAVNNGTQGNAAPMNVQPIKASSIHATNFATKTVTPFKLNSSSKGDTTMQDNVLNAFNDQAKAMYMPMSKFNSLLVESMEKMTEFQLNTIKSYAEIGLGQMKNAANIQDAEGMRQFTAAQAEATSIVNKKILEDAKIMSDMAADFRNKIEDVMAQTRQTAEKATVVSAKKAN